MPMTKTDRQKRPMRNCDRHAADKSGTKFAKLLMFIQVLRENSPMHIPHRRHAFSILVSQFDWSYMPLRLINTFSRWMTIMAATHTNVFTTAPVRKVGFFTTLIASLRDWNDQRATRAQLSKLTDRELNDIGLCRGDIEMVVEKTFR
jgi:uncharacterized protein YjiS (DUF1127 family)